MNIPDLKDVATTSRQVATKSVMNSIQWTTIICSPVGFAASAVAPSPINYFILCISAFPIFVTCWGFRHFAVNDPRRLHSEQHIENMELISGSRMLDKATGEVIEITGENVKPDLPALEGPSND